jgi:Kef-type K+ transport system membrane component KefB
VLTVLPAVDVVGYVLADLAIILLAARLVGGLFVRLRQPRVVGEMVAGILIGPTLLGGTLATATRPGSGLADALYPAGAFAFLSVLGTLALVLYTFLIGLQVPQHRLRGNVGRVGLVGTAAVAASVGLGFVLATVLDAPGLWRVSALPDGRAVSLTAHALLIASGLAATALPVVARILQEKGLLTTPVGTLGIGATAVITPLTFLVLEASVASLGPDGALVSTAVRLALTGALVAVLVLAVRPLLARLLARRFRPDEPLDGTLFAVLLAGAFLTALAADRIGIQALTGGLLFGFAVPQVPGLADAVVARLQQIVVMFGIPVFLAVSGLQTDLRVVRPVHLGAIALFVLAIAVAKWGVGTLVGRVAGLPAAASGALGVMAACGGLVTLVVALAAQQLGLITPSMQVVFVTSAIITTLATGPLLDRLIARPPRADTRQPID